MINRLDFFALLFFQIAITFALAEVMQKRSCEHCNSGAAHPAVFDQLVLADH